MSLDINTYTYLNDAQLYVCDDCGAQGKSVSQVEHYSSCYPRNDYNATKCWKCNQITMTLHGCNMCGADTEY